MDFTSHLHILWTQPNLLTMEKMVHMYSTNSLKNGWWEEVTVIIWGATAKFVAEEPAAQACMKSMMDKGVHVSACRACADQLGVTEVLETLGVEVIYWGDPLTKLIKGKNPLLTV
jgi:hypothetical protein